MKSTTLPIENRGPQHVSDKIASTVSYTAGVSTATAGALTLNDWALIVGIIVSLGTFAVNWYYKHKTVKILARQNTGNDDADKHKP